MKRSQSSRFGSATRHGVALLLCGLALTGCKEEQELYSYQGEPGSSTRVTAAPPEAQAAAAAGLEVSTSAADAILPPPDQRQPLADDAVLEYHDVAGVRVWLPGDWEALPAGQLSSMRAGQWTVPNPGGGATGELVAFNFGVGQGGDAFANIQRWVGQVEPEPGAQPDIYQHQSNGLTLTEVYLPGTLKPSTMGVGPTEPVPGSALYGLVVEGGPLGAVFLKLTGPRALIEGSFPALATVCKSIELTTR
jgi:hypothetical protein